MDILKVIGIAILTTFAVLLLKPTRPEVAAIVSVAGGVIVLLMFVNALSDVVGSMTAIVSRTGIKSDVFAAILKIIGIGYLTEFAANICADAGNNAMGQKIILAGKVIILVIALPIINALVELVAGMI